MYLKLGTALVALAAVGAIYWEISSTYKENDRLKLEIAQEIANKEKALSALEYKNETIAALESLLESNNSIFSRLDKEQKETLKEVQRLKLKRHDYEALRNGSQRELVLKIVNKALKDSSLEITGNES